MNNDANNIILPTDQDKFNLWIETLETKFYIHHCFITYI